ncbi:hypothetical protein EVAR_72705_1 [Eumeta japonica]|uniref:Uncharacterized protein n=1 Tax=Eumeta variegata TaxID=151549 RepID=A0A4C1TC07_EUMVA|nr:hypothetical protein EVAR_72705_1 [Eumeta japonica]
MFRKICLKSVPLFVEEFHRARKPAPLHRFLVHGQSSDDKQRPYAKSQVCAVLRRRVPHARKPAPLHRFLVHGQSGDDKQRPYAQSQVCADIYISFGEEMK